MKESTEKFIQNQNEEEKLLKDDDKIIDTTEKNRLLLIINRIQEDLKKEDNKTLDNVLEKYVTIEEKNKKIREKEKWLKWVTFRLYLPIICTINLIGIFIIISVYNTLHSFFWTSLSFFIGFQKKIPNYNFYDLLFYKSLNESANFNLVFFMNFLGQIILKSCGFQITSGIFMTINFFILIILYNFDFSDFDKITYNYDFIKIMLIFFLLLGMFISVGSSTSLSQQRLIENILRYKEEKEKKDKGDTVIETKTKNGKEIDNKNEEEETNIYSKYNLDIDNIDNKKYFISFPTYSKNNFFFPGNNIIINKNEENIDVSVDNNLIIKRSKTFAYKNDGKEVSHLQLKKKRKNIIKKLYSSRKNKNIDIEEKKELEDDLKYCNDKIKEKEEEKKRKMILSCFPTVSYTTVVGYALKYTIINIFLSNKKYQYENELIKNVTNNTNDNIYYQNINNISKDYFYNSNSPYNNSIFDEKFYKHDKNLFFYIVLAFFFSILLSIILYFVFTLIFEPNKKNEGNINDSNKEKESQNKDNSYIINKLCGCVLYCEKTSTEKSTSLNKSCCNKCCKLCCKSIKNYCDNIICEQCIFCFLNVLPCKIKGKLKCPCCCCCEYNEKDYDKNHEIFFYIYREKMFCNWLNKYLNNKAQIKIIPYIIEYFFLQLVTIAYEREYENEKKEKIFDFKNNVIYLLYFFLSFQIFMIYTSNIRSFEFDGLIDDPFHLVFFFQCCLVLVNTFFKLSINISFILLIKKFFLFTLNYYLITISKDEKDLELIPISALASAYITFFNCIIIFLNWALKSIDALYIIQTISSIIPGLLIMFVIIYLFFSLIINFLLSFYFYLECDKCLPNSCGYYNGYCFCNYRYCIESSRDYNEKCDSFFSNELIFKIKKYDENKGDLYNN